jgi:RNA polymerase sigma-70 factor, ECF subfamily
VRDAAVARLHAMLLRAARFELERRRGTLGHVRDGLEEIALESADDALVGVLARLDDYRGLSAFTTWAYKFALLEAAVKLRRRAWQGHEAPISDRGWALLADRRGDPGAAAERAELLEAVRGAIGTDLTPRQREVLVATAIDGVPIDVLAERLGTTRGALYKTVHDARRRLRARLAERGFDLGP